MINRIAEIPGIYRTYRSFDILCPEKKSFV